jgi:DinB superfamily
MKQPARALFRSSLENSANSSQNESTLDTDLRYPAGHYQAPEKITAAQREAWIAELANLPQVVEQAVVDLTDSQLDTPYRPGGWTVRQVVHHLPDSHINSYTRFRLALTEDSPVIKPYEESRWAELADAKTAPIALSLSLLGALHARWAILLRSLDDTAYVRTLQHPQLGTIGLDWNLGLYAWHGRHHTAQITNLRKRCGW